MQYILIGTYLHKKDLSKEDLISNIEMRSKPYFREFYVDMFKWFSPK